MAKKVGHYVTRPGYQPSDPPVSIPVAKELETVPGIPTRDGDVSFFSREYPLENVTLEESAAVEWHLEVRKTYSPEANQLYEREDRSFEPIVQWLKNTPNLEPTKSPTGEEVTELIRQKAKELGYGEVGFTRYDHRYVYQSRKKDVRTNLPHAICLALEQPYEPTQSIPSLVSRK